MAHNYSSNKLPFLNLARQAFASAKNILPLPYLSDENGSYDSPATSPALTGFASNNSVDATQAAPPTPTHNSPTPSPFGATSRRSSIASSDYCQDDTRPSSYCVPDFDDYSPRQPLQDINRLSVTHGFDLIDRDSDEGLRRCLKLDPLEQHSDLAPQPLFINKKSSVVDLPVLKQLLPPVPSHGTLQTAQRQTALRVPPLVNIYESLSTFQDRSPPSNYVYATANASLHLVRYNAQLSSFRTQLSAHLAFISDAITKTMIIQKEHKAKQSKRLASYWMLKSAAEASEEVHRKAADKKERIDRLRQNGWKVNKERFGWKGDDYYRELRRSVDVELGGSIGE